MMVNKDIQNALLTWYAEDHELHADLVHPVTKLAGESGELLDLVAKHLYKPNFDMWQCARCNHPMDYHLTDDGNNPDGNWRNAKYCIHCDDKEICDCQDYTPQVLDEVGDITYYQRILKHLMRHHDTKRGDFPDILEYLSVVNLACASILHDLIWYDQADFSRLRVVEKYLGDAMEWLGVSYDDIIELNYKKLNSEETNHGWKRA